MGRRSGFSSREAERRQAQGNVSSHSSCSNLAVHHWCRVLLLICARKQVRQFGLDSMPHSRQMHARPFCSTGTRSSAECERLVEKHQQDFPPSTNAHWFALEQSGQTDGLMVSSLMRCNLAQRRSFFQNESERLPCSGIVPPTLRRILRASPLRKRPSTEQTTMQFAIAVAVLSCCRSLQCQLPKKERSPAE